jgi:lipoprotein-releasing system permease protein
LYKLLLCWRYLRTRYLAIVCIGSVMLGVATLIVVNSVMSGFSTKLRDRLHGLLSDVIVEAWDYDGFLDPEGKMALIKADPFLNERIEAMAPTLEIFAMIQFRCRDAPFARTVRLIGIDPAARARLGGFAEHLVSEENQKHPSFDLSPEARRHYEERLRFRVIRSLDPPEPFPAAHGPVWDGGKPPPETPRPSVQAPQGIILGYAIAHVRDRTASPDGEVREVRILEPGDEVVVTTVSGAKLAPVNYRYVVVDYFRSEMSDYDSNYVFVPLEHLQKLRTMEDRATSIEIRLKDYRDARPVVERLKKLFAGHGVEVQTWEDKQGPLLAAIRVEKGILNVLLFLIIAVAGFGILAIFSMIVVEKTRDIGILKALGASNTGVMKIFLGYGLLLGLLGAGLGTALGLSLTWNINAIEKGLAWLTGMELFPKDVYYFKEIPTNVDPLSVLLVNAGAVGIAVVFSVLPALRAALLHPVRALRYE